MTSAADALRPGDRVELTFDDAPHDTIVCTVTGFSSDQEMGFSPEIEDYVACWVQLGTADGVKGTEPRSIVLGTDSRYSLDGRAVTFHKVKAGKGA